MSDDSPQLNSQIQEAVTYTNGALSQQHNIDTNMPEAMLTSQAKGLVKLSAAQYVDAVMKISVAEQSILMKELAEFAAKKDAEGIDDVKSAMSVTNDMTTNAVSVGTTIKIY